LDSRVGDDPDGGLEAFDGNRRGREEDDGTFRRVELTGAERS
jgi:hypothetical protein